MSKHTSVPIECQQTAIQEISEIGDNEYYLSALNTTNRDVERARRGRIRIINNLEKLKELQRIVKCPACQ